LSNELGVLRKGSTSSGHLHIVLRGGNLVGAMFQGLNFITKILYTS